MRLRELNCPEVWFGGIFATLFVALVVGVSIGKLPPMERSQPNNSAATIELLFEKDGIRVYRFYDNYRPIYYTDPTGSTRWMEQHGKGNYAPQGIN